MGVISLSKTDLRRIAVAIDPAATSGEQSDDTGLIVVGLGPCQPDTCALAREHVRCPGHGYVLDDLTCHLPPAGWAKVAIKAYDKWQADVIVAEVNNGGDMVGNTVRGVRSGVPYKKVVASRGKAIRAEPVAALSDQGRIHLMGEFPDLYTELTTWTPDAGWSPNRLDAFVWGMTELGLVGGQGHAFMEHWRRQQLAGAWETDTIPDELTQLPRMGEQASAVALAEAQNACRCPDGQRRFFDGVCVKCGGKPR